MTDTEVTFLSCYNTVGHARVYVMVSEAYLPAVQLLQAEAPESEYSPAAQLAQAEAPESEYLPAAQAE